MNITVLTGQTQLNLRNYVFVKQAPYLQNTLL